MANRYECVHRVTFRCTNGTRKAERCPACGGQVVKHVGDYGVFKWRRDGCYILADAFKVYQDPVAAKRFADPKNLVVRFIPRSRESIS